MCSISVVDVSKVSTIKPNPSFEDYHEVGNRIKECFEQIGFVYFSNHGINQSIIDHAMKASMEFFNLQKEIKNRTKVGKEYQGWREEGREMFGQNREIRETYDLKNISSTGIFPDVVSYHHHHRHDHSVSFVRTVPSSERPWLTSLSPVKCWLPDY